MTDPKMPERMTVGRIEQLTMSPEMKDRWEHNVQVRIATGKTINTSCVLAAQAKIDMCEVFLKESSSRESALKGRLETAGLLLEMSQSLVPKREPTCTKGDKCILCRMRDEYHDRVADFLTTQGE